MSRKQTETTPGRRGRGGRGAGLDREAIVGAAAAMMDRDGVSGLTVRRLAAELGVDSAALYWHFRGKDDICRAVVEHIGAQLRVTVRRAGTPRTRLEHHLLAIHDHWRRHPSALELSRRYPPTAAGDVARAGMALLDELGVPEDLVLDRYRVLVWSVMGFSIVEQALAQSVHHQRVTPDANRYTVSLDGEPDSVSELDTDRLFADTVRLLLDAIEGEVAAGRRDPMAGSPPSRP